jgi:signal transduction histidine kinase
MTDPRVMKKKTFTVDARTILLLGRQSIRDHLTAMLELVKNSWDADATLVEVALDTRPPQPYIRIADNGCGMTERDVDENWLRIGFSEKRRTRLSRRKRRKTGEKGVGRISADRLGAILELRTHALDGQFFGLRVNWDDFDVDGKDLSAVGVAVLPGARFTPPAAEGAPASATGTELIIRDLRQQWTPADVEGLHSELALLLPPFRGVADFAVVLQNDLVPELNGAVTSPFIGTAEIELTAELAGQWFTYQIRDRIGHNGTTAKGRVQWSQLVQRNLKRGEATKAPLTGPVRIVLLFYPRKASFLRGTEFHLGDLREFLDRNAGVRIYRDEIRVRPYGDPREPSGDWLGLAERRTRDPAGVARRSFKVAANQLVGAVFIGRDENPALIDSASREGLIEDDAFRDLRALVLSSLNLLEAHRHQAYQLIRVSEPQTPPTEQLSRLKKDLGTLRSNLAIVRGAIPRSASRPVNRALDQVEEVAERLKAAEDSLQEVMSQTGVLRGLATLGIATSVFGHETQTALGEFIGSTFAAAALLAESPPDVTGALDEVGKAKRYGEQISAWGSFALSRVRRDKRTRSAVSVDTLISDLIRDLSPAFTAAAIEVRPDLAAVTVSTFAMDIEAILLNLLTNAYIACQQSRAPRYIGIGLLSRPRNGSPGFEMIVSDSGPGVPPEFAEQIWKPLFTMRRDETGREVGTGLGLTIVDSILKDMKGARTVDRDEKLGGARFTIWVPGEAV